MEAVKLQEQSSFSKNFSTLFSTPIDSFSLDLTNASLIDVLRHHESFKRRNNEDYTHSAVITLIEDIEQMSGGVSIMPIQVNGIFYDYLLDYLINGKGLQPSTADNYFGQISSSVAWSSKYGAKINPSYADYNVKYNEKEKYALSLEEVCLIYDFDISKLTKDEEYYVEEMKKELVEVNRKGKKYTRHIEKKVKTKAVRSVPMFRKEHMEVLQRVKDMFVLSCMLYQRYSDMKKVCPENFSEDRQTYRVTQQKTGGVAVVNIKAISPSPDIAFAILKKYDYHAPYTYNINSYNRHLHQLIELIGGRFEDTIIFEDKQFGEVRKYIKHLKECITSHTARRTAITLATKTNNEFAIRRASGHKDGRSFAKYVCYKD